MTTSVPARRPASPAVDKTPTRIAGMFDAIAPRYDLLNHVLSAGLDRRWRNLAVDALALPEWGARARPLHRDRGSRRGHCAEDLRKFGDWRGLRGRDAQDRQPEGARSRARKVHHGSCVAMPPAFLSATPRAMGRQWRSVSAMLSSRRWPWPSWRVCSGPAGDWPSSSSASRASRDSARYTRGTSAICCRSSAAQSRSTRAHIPTCRRRSERFRHRRNFYKCVKVRALAECVPSL